MTENILLENSDQKIESALEEGAKSIGLEENQTSVPQQKNKIRTKAKQPQPTRVYDCIVIGAGISGIAAAYKMIQAGYTDFLVFEKADRVGGTWRDNTYPGCGCDVPSALYSFSFAPSHAWSHLFAKQTEILAYLEQVTKQFNLNDKIKFKHELLSAKWNEARQQWVLETSQGKFLAKTVVFLLARLQNLLCLKLRGLIPSRGKCFIRHVGNMITI